MLGYRACMLRDSHQARGLLSGPADSVLTELLSALAKEGEQLAQTLEAQFLEARKRLDWKGVQELGKALMGNHPEYVPILRRSLEFRPNHILWSAINALQPEAAAMRGGHPGRAPDLVRMAGPPPHRGIWRSGGISRRPAARCSRGTGAPGSPTALRRPGGALHGPGSQSGCPHAAHASFPAWSSWWTTSSRSRAFPGPIWQTSTWRFSSFGAA